MLDIYYQNVQGLRTKTNSTLRNVLTSNYKIIAFTETWLNVNINNNEIIDDRYIVYRRDRMSSTSSKKDGGGVMLAVSRDIPSVREVTWESDAENLWVTLQLKINNIMKNISICVVYLPPPVKLDTLSNVLDNIESKIDLCDDLVILGDFNLGFIEWNTNNNCSQMFPSSYYNLLGYKLIDFMSTNALYQLNSICNSNNRFLDLVLCSSVNASVKKPLNDLTHCNHHHPSLLLTLCFNGNISYLRPKNNVRYNYFKADYTSIVDKLASYNWLSELSCSEDVNINVNRFYKILNDVIEEFVPKRKPRKTGYPCWFSKSLINLLKEKNKTRKKYLKFNNPRDEQEFRLLRGRCKKLHDMCLADYNKTIQSNIAKNPKAFWSHIKNKRGGLSTIPTKMHLNYTVASSGVDIANLFVRHFRSVYSSNTATAQNPINQNLNSFDCDCIATLKFIEKNVLVKIKKIDIFNGAGPDSIPPVFVRRCAPIIALPLTLIFNNSLETGVFPEVWKRAKVVPVFKKGLANDVKNYRPISILSCFPKLFESLIYPTISTLIEKKLSDKQHGFRPLRSTQTNLVPFISDLSEEVDRGMQVDAIYTDFSSAFDKVDHKILVSKLNYLGIQGTLLDWFKSYLSDRLQSVVISGHESEAYLADSGVPQGSHLGPVLFLVFINDITTKIKHCRISLFADDLKIYKVVGNAEDAGLIQDDIDGIVDWCDLNNMYLNPTKCCYIKYARKRKAINAIYKIRDISLNEVDTVRDLGVYIDRQLKFTSHVDHAVTKAAQMLGFLKRNTVGFTQQTKIILYNAYVRSHLEYASTCWNPYYAVHSQRIESIQRAYTRHLAFQCIGFSHRSPYDQRLSKFKMISLNKRRLLLAMCFLHKLVHGQAQCSDLLQRLNLFVPYNYPRHHIKKLFSPPASRTNLGLQSPINKIQNDYNMIQNKIPDLDIFNDSFTKFRQRIQKFMFTDAKSQNA